eukprot:scaffold1769_cov277-Prasinococcus_capsulatus_cf.AAC.4
MGRSAGRCCRRRRCSSCCCCCCCGCGCCCCCCCCCGCCGGGGGGAVAGASQTRARSKRRGATCGEHLGVDGARVEAVDGGGRVAQLVGEGVREAHHAELGEAVRRVRVVPARAGAGDAAAATATATATATAATGVTRAPRTALHAGARRPLRGLARTPSRAAGCRSR